MSKRNMSARMPIIFRSYQSTDNPAPDCTIWEALYATMAHPDLFKSITISDGPIQHSFVGGELGASNPIVHVLTEVRRLYPDRHVSCVLSIGAGHARTIHIPDPSPLQRLLRAEFVQAMKDMATDSEREAEAMAQRFQEVEGTYYRLNVDQGMQSMKADDWERLEEIKAHTKVYINKLGPSGQMDGVIKAIESRKAAVSVIHIG